MPANEPSTIVRIPLPDNCSVTPKTVYGHKGWFRCNTSLLEVNWNGHWEVFGIGTDFAIWHIASWFNGWRSMGGQAADMNWAFYDANGHPRVQVYVGPSADESDYWCSTYTSSWSGWYPC